MVRLVRVRVWVRVSEGRIIAPDGVTYPSSGTANNTDSITVLNKNLCGRDGRTICGPQCVPKSTSVTKRRKDVTDGNDNGTDGQTDGQTDRQTDRQIATQYAAPS